MTVSSFSAILGFQRRREDEPPPVPDALAARNDMTLAQKQRLTVMAKMGVIPEHHGPSVGHWLDSVPFVRDRRAEMLERERRMRDEQEEIGEEQAASIFERRAKRVTPGVLSIMGVRSLGQVMPREGPQVPVVPAQLHEPKQVTLRISKDISLPKSTAERAAKVGAAFQEDAAEDESSSGDDQKKKQDEYRRKEREKRAAAAKLEREKELKQRQQGKKKKKKRGRDGDPDEDWQGDESEEEEVDIPRLVEASSSRAQMMVFNDLIKGKVSTANKGMTDADLERRFSQQQQDSQSSAGDGSLMTEEQVLMIIRREKAERGAGGERGGASASRRVQRELDEWAEKKAHQRARVKSPTRFERMVIARK